MEKIKLSELRSLVKKILKEENSEYEFNFLVGSIYQAKIKEIKPGYFSILQDNQQEVVLPVEDIPTLINLLNEIYEKE